MQGVIKLIFYMRPMDSSLSQIESLRMWEIDSLIILHDTSVH